MKKTFDAGKLPPDFLEDLLRRLPAGDTRVRVGPRVGEDAAVIDMGDRYLVAKTDPITFATDRIGWYLANINANDVANYPEDSPDKMAEEAKEAGYTFPYVYDETQETAKAYTAACTPDFFLFDADRKLAYRGQLDDSRPGNGVPVTGQDLREALDALLAGKSPLNDQKPSIGCNIKWIAGNAPEYG